MSREFPTALVTGGAKRVGRRVVETLAGAGFHVVFTFHTSADDAESLADQFENVTPICVDLASPPAVNEVRKAVDAVSDRLDLVFNNASIYVPDSKADAATLFRVNFETPVAIVRSLAPKLRSSRGCVINMLDILAERPMAGYSVYCASKAALASATVSLARELAPEVNVNGIAPGVVDFPDDMPESERQAYLRKVPLGRAGTPDDVAKLVTFLATDGRYITGQTIRLDGGRSIVW